jgi:hypothetical protein
MDFVTPKEINGMLEGYDTFKFVIVGGKFRFARFDGYLSHKDMVAKGEVAEGAGYIGVNAREWKMITMGSDTLHVGFTAAQENELEKLLTKPQRRDY